MQPSNYNPKAFMQLIRVIYCAQIAGLLLFLLVALYISKNSPTFEFNLEDPFTIIVLFIQIAIPVGYLYSNKIFKSYEPNSTLKEKLPKFQLGLIIRLAFIQGAGLFSIVSSIILKSILRNIHCICVNSNETELSNSRENRRNYGLNAC